MALDGTCEGYINHILHVLCGLYSYVQLIRGLKHLILTLEREESS